MENESGVLLLADPVPSDKCYYVKAYFGCCNVVQPADFLALMSNKNRLFACVVFLLFYLICIYITVTGHKRLAKYNLHTQAL